MTLKEIYGEKFHRHRLGKVAYSILAEASLQAYNTAREGSMPSTVCDVGCSAGALLYRLKEKIPALVTDGMDCDVPARDIVFTGNYINVDLNTYAGGFGGGYDLVVCQEVIEHIVEENSDKVLNLIDDISKKDTVLIFSGAIPGQDGTYHVNCQTVGHWKERLSARGWNYAPEAHAIYNASISLHPRKGRVKQYVQNTIIMIKGK